MLREVSLQHLTNQGKTIGTTPLPNHISVVLAITNIIQW